MNLNNFKLLKEDDDSYHIGHPNGKAIQIAKKGLSEKSHLLINAMKSTPQKFDGGGQEADDEDESPSTPAPATPQSPIASTGTPPLENVPIPSSKPFEEEKAAITAGAQATAAQGAAEAKAIQETQDQAEQLPTQQEIVDANHEKNQQLFQAYQNKQIDPDRYLHSMGTGSKIAAGIGMLLSGFGGGASRQAPQAQAIIQNAISNDIASQRNDQNQAMNLWKMNREALGSDLAANLATENQYYTGLKYKLFQAASQFKGPQAMAAAQQANAMIDMKLMQNNQLMGLHAGLSGQAGDGTEAGFVNNMNTAQRFAPDQYKDAQSKYIPSVGIAQVPLTADNRTELTAYDALGKDLDSAINFQKNVAGDVGAWTPANKATAENLKNSLTVQLGKLYGLKRLNDREYENYLQQVGNIGGINLGSEQIKLQNLKQQLDGNKKATLTNLGVKPFAKAPADQNAIAWARTNPNDPRSARILQANGIQ